MGLRLPPPTRLCLLRTCATPAWVRSPPSFRPLPDGPPLAFSSDYISLFNYLLFCISLRFRLALLSIVGPPLALPTVVGQPRALTLFFRPRLASTLLRWPPLALLLLRIHPLALGFLWRLWSLVRCGSLCGPQPVALRSLNVRQSNLSPFLIVFPPGFRLSTPGCMFGLRLYIDVHRLYRLFCPVRGGTLCGHRCPVATASAFMSFMAKAAPRCYYDRSLCFFWLIVLCVSQPKMSRWVVLYGHRKRRVPWNSPEFILALSRTRSLSSDL